VNFDAQYGCFEVVCTRPQLLQLIPARALQRPRPSQQAIRKFLIKENYLKNKKSIYIIKKKVFIAARKPTLKK
jgi:hypothetical protein